MAMPILKSITVMMMEEMETTTFLCVSKEVQRLDIRSTYIPKQNIFNISLTCDIFYIIFTVKGSEPPTTKSVVITEPIGNFLVSSDASKALHY